MEAPGLMMPAAQSWAGVTCLALVSHLRNGQDWGFQTVFSRGHGWAFFLKSAPRRVGHFSAFHP